jgi:hypothetical protein
MDGLRLADRLAYGAGCAARRTGFLYDAYRPDGLAAPLNPANRFMRLCVAFVLPSGAVGSPAGLTTPYRQAWVDWSYLRVGDYLSGPDGVAFVAAIEPPKPMLAVMTNACISLARPGVTATVGLNEYGAVEPGAEIPLVTDYPASLLVGGGSGDRTRNGLPDDTKVPGVTALLPRVAGVVPLVADILSNQRGERFVVSSVEELSGIWRIFVVQAVR